MRRPALLAVLTLGSTAAFAHGDASWIMTDPATRHCCGRDDCGPDIESLVQVIPGGWRILDTGQIFLRSTPENIFPSVDKSFWTCREHKAPDDLFPYTHDRWVRCLFVPTES
jgi:hypothetical protein